MFWKIIPSFRTTLSNPPLRAVLRSVRCQMNNSADQIRRVWQAGVSYARTVREFVARRSGTSITGRLNLIYGQEGNASELDSQLAEMQSRSLDRENGSNEWRDLPG